MTCRNCDEKLSHGQKFCANCGAEVVLDRITSQTIVKSFTAGFFGWDNTYLKTVWRMLAQPGDMLRDYLAGTRKRYTPPIAFVGFGMFLATLAFSQFADEFVAFSSGVSEEQAAIVEGATDLTNSDLEADEVDVQRGELNVAVQERTLQYFNFLTFLFLPFYAMVSKLVFGKPHNYAEHLIINCYVQGFSFVVATVLFLAALLIHPSIYGIGLVFTNFYYLYVYARLNRYSIGRVVVKQLKFFVMLVFSGMLLATLGALIGAGT